MSFLVLNVEGMAQAIKRGINEVIKAVYFIMILSYHFLFFKTTKNLGSNCLESNLGLCQYINLYQLTFVCNGYF